MKGFAIFAALLLTLPAGARDFAARSSVGAEVKLARGLRLGVQEELRTGDGLSAMDDVRSTLDLSCKLNRYVEFSGGYTLINPCSQSASGFADPRHRLFFGITGTCRLGDFQFSLREKLQYTHRSDVNIYQTPPDAFALKSRIGLKYKGIRHWEPFGYFELRTALNESWGKVTGGIQTTRKKEKDYYSFTHTGYTNIYNDRFRFNLGTDWTPARRHTLRFNVLADYISKLKLDTNSEGTRIFIDTTGWENTFRLSFCLGYKYSF